VTIANTIFLLCLVVGGGLLLIAVFVGDLFGGILDALHFGVDLGGVSLMPLLLGFVSMFGVGGLFSTQVFGLDAGRASLVGAVTGAVGSLLVYLMFGMLRRAEAPEAFSLNDLVGQTGRISVGIPAGRYGTVLLTFAGESHNLTATAEIDVPAGATVKVDAVAGSNLVVSPLAVQGERGGQST
jgi:membrane protein implicated in regulation of membrane protease activity